MCSHENVVTFRKIRTMRTKNNEQGKGNKQEEKN